METKRLTQVGTVQIIIFGILLILFSLKSYDFGVFETSGLLYAGLSTLMLACILFTYKIVIEIDEHQISFKFGIGLFKRTYQMIDLTSCSSIRCSLLNGFGIRRIANGWLYNMSGLDAIELRFNDKKSIIQIGTKNSEEIAIIVTNLIKKQQDTNESPQIDNTTSIDWGKRIGYVVIVIAILSFFYTIKNDDIKANKDNLVISGIYGKSINYSQIIKIDTISVIPEIESRTNGSYLMSQAKGHFRLYDVGSAYLNLNLKYPPFIRIILRNDNYIFLNLCDAKKTLELFKNIEKKTLKNTAN
jgi:hypothetical protein